MRFTFYEEKLRHALAVPLGRLGKEWEDMARANIENGGSPDGPFTEMTPGFTRADKSRDHVLRGMARGPQKLLHSIGSRVGTSPARDSQAELTSRVPWAAIHQFGTRGKGGTRDAPLRTEPWLAYREGESTIQVYAPNPEYPPRPFATPKGGQIRMIQNAFKP